MLHIADLHSPIQQLIPEFSCPDPTKVKRRLQLIEIEMQVHIKERHRTY